MTWWYVVTTSQRRPSYCMEPHVYAYTAIAATKAEAEDRARAAAEKAAKDAEAAAEKAKADAESAAESAAEDEHVDDLDGREFSD